MSRTGEAREISSRQRKPLGENVDKGKGRETPYLAIRTERSARGCLRSQVAQHVVQNAAVLEIFDLVEGIDTAEHRHLD